ncbi:hypothetical protein GP486_000816 [Trichoglossum hirsutum]|uniref:Nucleoside phosphorylase domain-containing protein n=1 Tax=Trichoglossum hirsutum TaxID=265104 RepID=A0A9P8LI78_9PEZI|nr:hypothetical protein GP486_000816 [Trichoglossum hirsutum]
MAEDTPLSVVFQLATETAQYLRMFLPPPLRGPRVGIICGSGLGGLADTIHPEPKYEVAYADVPHFPKSTSMSIGIVICFATISGFLLRRKLKELSLITLLCHTLVEGHAGKLVYGLLGEKRTPVVLMVGRVQLVLNFETHLLRVTGTEYTNSLRSFYEGHTIEKITFPVRVLKLLGIESLIVGIHPLRGPNADEFGVRFPSLSDAYDLELRRIVHRAWKMLQLGRNGRRIHEGVYAFVGGPS